MSGVDLPDGTIIRKGAADAIEKYVTARAAKFLPNCANGWTKSPLWAAPP